MAMHLAAALVAHRRFGWLVTIWSCVLPLWDRLYRLSPACVLEKFQNPKQLSRAACCVYSPHRFDDELVSPGPPPWPPRLAEHLYSVHPHDGLAGSQPAVGAPALTLGLRTWGGNGGRCLLVVNIAVAPTRGLVVRARLLSMGAQPRFVVAHATSPCGAEGWSGGVFACRPCRRAGDGVRHVVPPRVRLRTLHP